MALGVRRPYIETAGTEFNVERASRRQRISVEEAHRARVRGFLAQHGLPMVDDWTPVGEPVEAVLEAGRWVVKCPTEGCYGCELVDPDWPYFVCAGGCGRGPHEVVFPDGREKIEGELLKRDDPMWRGWQLGERLEHLKLETAILEGRPLFPREGRDE